MFPQLRMNADALVRAHENTGGHSFCEISKRFPHLRGENDLYRLSWVKVKTYSISQNSRIRNQENHIVGSITWYVVKGKVQLPFSCLIVGPSEIRKTYFIEHVLKTMNM